MAYQPQQNEAQYGGNGAQDQQHQQPNQQQYASYEQQGGFQCSECQQAFTADSMSNEIKYKTVGDKFLHFECFRCSNCQQQIDGKYNLKEDGSFLCINCIGQQYGQDTQVVAVDKNNPIHCTVCNKELTKAWIEGAKGEKYHNYCVFFPVSYSAIHRRVPCPCQGFKCMDCGSPLSKEPEYCEFQGNNYCMSCRKKQMNQQ